VLAVAAAAVVALAVAGGLVAAGRGDDPEVLASAVLEPLTDVTEPAGEARLVDSGDGQRLDITFDGELPSAAGFYEVWLIDRQVDGMVSLGPVRADGSYDVPAGVDVERFPVVDVSVEPTDGDPAHSGASVLRGTLA
jgi:anti-sigma-K factor RskA